MIVSSYDLFFFLNFTSVLYVYSFNCNWPWSCLEAGPCFTFIFCIGWTDWTRQLLVSALLGSSQHLISFFCPPIFLSPLFLLIPSFHLLSLSLFFSVHGDTMTDFHLLKDLHSKWNVWIKSLFFPLEWQEDMRVMYKFLLVLNIFMYVLFYFKQSNALFFVLFFFCNVNQCYVMHCYGFKHVHHTNKCK